MAEQQQTNSETVRPAASGSAKRAAAEAAEAIQSTASSTSAAASGVAPRRKWHYMIAVRPLPGAPADSVFDALSQMDGVEILGRRSPKGLQGFGPGILPGAQEIILVRMDEQRAEALRQSAPAQITVESDCRLSGSPTLLLEPPSPWWAGRPAPLPFAARTLRFKVLGADEQPLANAGITVAGRLGVAQAITDSAGNATVELFDFEADSETIRALHVHPAADHWDCFLRDPQLDLTGTNVAKLRPLAPAAPKANGEKARAWGRRALNVDQAASGLTGSGVRIGLIDSGCDNTHPLLRHVTRGTDLSGNKDWTRDPTGQGTHCAGIIAGAAGTASGVQGLAPEAELHVFKVAPGGHFSDLIEAIDLCIESQVDIIHLGIGSDQVSELVAQKIVEARLRGIACIAASGDGGGAVQFPAMVPGVLAVSAIGKLGEYSRETHHEATAIPDMVAPNGLFATNFSGAGPQVGLCGPGVAVISCVPGGGLAARDGTAVAAAHIAGFAALVLAHHPTFRGLHGTRNAHRVSALFGLIQGSAVAPVFDRTRIGAGLPDLQRVPGLGAMPDVESWSQAMRSGGLGARESEAFGMPPGISPAHLADTAALMQLRAAGLL